MSAFKIGIDCEEVMQKRRVHIKNFRVCAFSEYFTCGAQVRMIASSTVVGKKVRDDLKFGIAKQEFKVSCGLRVCRCQGGVYGG